MTRSMSGVNPQIVSVSYGGTRAPEKRLVSVDVEQNLILFNEINVSENGEVIYGDEVTIRISHIGDTSVTGKTVELRAGGPLGPVLMKLDFDGEELAELWASVIKSGQTANNAVLLRRLIEQQEMQVNLLETLNREKAEQLLAHQDRLEEALHMLHEGQVSYSTQQRTLDHLQQEVIELWTQYQAVQFVEQECDMNAAQAVAGWHAVLTAREASQAGGATVYARAGGGTEERGAVWTEEDADDEEDGEEDEEQQRQRLQALSRQNESYEVLIQQERESLLEQVQSLQQVVTEMGIDNLPPGIAEAVASLNSAIAQIT